MSELLPIEESPVRDGRHYIPLPGGWEIQTKGNGSSFRICNTKDGDRRNVSEKHLHDFLERMGREIHAACTPASPDSKPIGEDYERAIATIENSLTHTTHSYWEAAKYILRTAEAIARQRAGGETENQMRPTSDRK